MNKKVLYVAGVAVLTVYIAYHITFLKNNIWSTATAVQ